MDRITAIRSMFDTSGFGLEIGPSYNPLCPKADGFNVEILDHATQADLRKKYEHARDIEKIEPVDYVSDGRPMQEVIGASKRYDFIIASHVIEHTTDIVRFLKDCETLLKDDGVLVLAVPDKRYCFDFFRPLSTTGQAIEAHRLGRTRHSYADVFDHRAYACHGIEDQRITWPTSLYPEKRPIHRLQMALDTAERSDAGPYIDTHAWQFTPSSFRLLVQELNALGFIGFKEANSNLDTRIWEFRIALSRAGAGSGLSRIDLLNAIAEETAAPEMAEFRKTFEAKQNEMRDQREEELQKRLETVTQELNAVRASTSWRITKPFRAVRAAMSGKG